MGRSSTRESVEGGHESSAAVVEVVVMDLVVVEIPGDDVMVRKETETEDIGWARDTAAA